MTGLDDKYPLPEKQVASLKSKTFYNLLNCDESNTHAANIGKVIKAEA